MTYIFGILAIFTLITFIWCVVLSFQLAKHNHTLKKHDKCARHFANRITAIRKENGDSSLDKINSDVEGILQETHGIVTYLKNLCWFFVPFCVIISSIYLITHFPRLINQVTYDNGQSSYAHLGIDYLGIIVSMFAIIVTLLVGWQIYATIKARQELTEAGEKIENRLDSRLKEFEDCCTQKGIEIRRLKAEKNKLREEFERLKTLTVNTRANLLRFMYIVWSASLLNLSKTVLLNRMLLNSIESLRLFIENKELDKANVTLNYV